MFLEMCVGILSKNNQEKQNVILENLKQVEFALERD